MMIVGMPGLTEAQNRSLFSLWCMMAVAAHRRQRPPRHDRATIAILTNLEAIAVNQDPLGVQGHVVWNDGNISLWAGKPLFDGSRAVLVFYQGRYRARRRSSGRRSAWPPTSSMSATSGRTRRAGRTPGGVTVSVGPDEVAFLRVSKKRDFPIPPIIVADTYLVSLRATGPRPAKLSGTVTVVNKGSAELPPWKVDPKSLPTGFR